MDYILTIRDQINIRWIPATYSWFSGYTVDQNYQDNEPLNYLCISITTKDKLDEDDLFSKISKILQELNNDDKEIRLEISNKTHSYEELIGIKPEYQDQASEIEIENQQTANKIIELCQKLDELGCRYESHGFTQKLIPEDWYEWRKGMTHEPIKIWCKNDSKFCQYLVDNGLIKIN